MPTPRQETDFVRYLIRALQGVRDWPERERARQELDSEQQKALDTGTAVCLFCLKAGAVKSSFDVGGWYHQRCLDAARGKNANT